MITKKGKRSFNFILLVLFLLFLTTSSYAQNGCGDGSGGSKIVGNITCRECQPNGEKECSWVVEYSDCSTNTITSTEVCVPTNTSPDTTSGTTDTNTALDTQVYYCASDADFTLDLDTKDEASCEAAGFFWTGTRCCSEADDPNEFYNDPNGAGGCWNKIGVLSGFKVPGLENAANLQGQFYGCNLNQTDVYDPGDVQDSVPLYRLWSQEGVDHFYTINSNEATYATSIGYTYEGVVGNIFTTQKPGTVELHRLWSLEALDHFYTTDDGERQVKESQGYNYEGVAGYIYPPDMDPKPANTFPLHHLFFTGSDGKDDNFYTLSDSEKAFAESSLGYAYQGIAGYIFSPKPAGQQDFPSTPILQVTDYNGAQLVENQQHCWQDTEKQMWCAVNNTWQISQGSDKSYLSSVPESLEPQPSQPSACCAPDQCWDGSICFDSQLDTSNPDLLNGTFRCVEGSWEEAILKFTPDGSESGYCPRQSDCLVDPNGNPEENYQPENNPVCIENQQFTDRYFCENGIWTTRTKFVALKLLDIAGTDNYVVFCDEPENAINNLQYLVQRQLAQNIVSPENTNNFCVLVIPGQVNFGTSLNKPLSELSEFFGVLGISSCNPGTADDQYSSCDSSNKAWYNQDLNAIIYSNTAVQLGPTDFLTALANFINNPFQTIINTIKALIQAPVDDISPTDLNKFDKLYISKQGSKEIKGTIDQNNLVIEYKNFNTNICEFVASYNTQHSDLGSGIECNKQGNTYHVLAQGNEFTTINPDQIWNDLTSKLRIT